MLLSILLPIRLDLLHPRRIRIGVEDCDNDDGRTAADCNFRYVGQGRRTRTSAYYPQEPEQCEEP